MTIYSMSNAIEFGHLRCMGPVPCRLRPIREFRNWSSESVKGSLRGRCFICCQPGYMSWRPWNKIELLRSEMSAAMPRSKSFFSGGRI
jgi:hypothetical protein